MITIKNPEKKRWPDLFSRPVNNTEEIRKSVKTIIEEVKADGDKALKKFAALYDNSFSEELEVSTNEAITGVSEELKLAIAKAKSNIEYFHLSQLEKTAKVETEPGVICWRKSVPIERVGLYIPGGSAPLFSTILMLAVPARIAGCEEIILCTPPDKNGAIHPAVLYTASLCGITKIYKTGGAQAIAAMAYGTESIPKADKIVGPGNQYVTLAKQMISAEGIAIDLPAGPSELLIIADETAIPSFIAADLLSQAEHGPDSQVVLISASEILIEATKQELIKQLENLPRKDIAQQALNNSKLVWVDNLDAAFEISNYYAPEHLILAINKAEEWSTKVKNAGSVFLGNYSPESAGDYASGTNHTLPTNGYAKAFSGVSLDSFVKKITFQQLSPAGLQSLGNTIEIMAAAEGLEAHKNAVTIRLKYLENENGTIDTSEYPGSQALLLSEKSIHTRHFDGC